MSGFPLHPERLETRFPDAKPLYDPGTAVAEASRCLYCHDAPCVAACPTGIDVPTFIRKIATGNVKGSARTILSANLLGYSCARVCPVEVLCVGACVYNAWQRPPIQIGRLQRFAVEATLDRGIAASLFERAAPTGRKVACVGSGPASLAVAGYLALEGVTPTVFERQEVPGGLNTSGVAPYKMPAEAALREVAFLHDLGIEIRTGVEVGRDVTPEDLLRDHDALFLGAGLGPDGRLDVPGADGPGVMGATEWIARMKLEPRFALRDVRRALVVGGGNTAVDVARELAQLGVPEVRLVYRRTEAEMPGYQHEVAHARAEGVRLLERAVPKAVHRAPEGALRSLELEDGRELPADLLVVAIGQSTLRDLLGRVPGIELDGRGCVVADPETGATGNPKVFVGGDVMGGELVVTAVQDAKRAARAICAAIGVNVRPASPMLAGHR